MNESCYIIFTDKDETLSVNIIMEDSKCLPEDEIFEIWGQTVLEQMQKTDPSIKAKDIKLFSTENEDRFNKVLSNYS